jgi:hypothetical protein
LAPCIAAATRFCRCKGSPSFLCPLEAHITMLQKALLTLFLTHCPAGAAAACVGAACIQPGVAADWRARQEQGAPGHTDTVRVCCYPNPVDFVFWVWPAVYTQYILYNQQAETCKEQEPLVTQILCGFLFTHPSMHSWPAGRAYWLAACIQPEVAADWRARQEQGNPWSHRYGTAVLPEP